MINKNYMHSGNKQILGVHSIIGLSWLCTDEFQIKKINVDLRTSGFDEVLSVDACAV